MTKNGISKSRYTLYRKCSKALWLSINKPEEQVVSDDIKDRLAEGNMVGDLAMGYFGPYVEVTTYNGEHLDIVTMCEKTKQEIARDTNVICEASFLYDGCYCAVDLLKKIDDGYAIYEVKAITQDDKTGIPSEAHLKTYAKDIAFQKWVLTQCGVKVTGTHLVYIDHNYVRHGDINVQDLFSTYDMSAYVQIEEGRVANGVHDMRDILAGKEPTQALDMCCHQPYECAFWEYCKRLHGIPEDKDTVFQAYYLSMAKKLELFHSGKVLLTDFDGCYFDTRRDGSVGNYEMLRQMHVRCHVNGQDYIDKEGIREFLTKIKYPVYHLDFETMKSPVPMFDDVWPNLQIPFQYSLHIEQADHNLTHKEFLGISGEDPRRGIAEALCRDIPDDACVTAYNKDFECGRLKELAELFPDLHDHLMAIREHIVDLLEPFRAGYYYRPAMHCSYSIKKVLPALWPNEPSLDYHNLAGVVHNGGEAMNIFPRIKDLPTEAERESAYHSLRIYCELDTFAMVKVLEKLREVSK